MSVYPITTTTGVPGTPVARILITGSYGQVGWNLQRTLSPLGEVIALSRDQLNLADLDAVAKAVRDSKANLVVNAAAYTAVDKAESEPELAHAVNTLAPARMAAELARTGGTLIHYSTDYVFDGSKTSPYIEDDPTGPLNVYGRSKLEGEQAIAASGCAHVILRTSWIYDIRGKNFLRTVLRLAREREELRMVGDQYGAPTWARTIAEATSAIAVQLLHHRGVEPGTQSTSGVFHLTAAGRTSWAEFADAIVKEYDDCCSWPADSGEFGQPLKVKNILSIATDEYPTPAKRPRNSVLSNEKIAAAFGIALPDWRSQLRLAMQDAIR
jgi:dTDP-4-dehydrorhamnose reductase